MNLPSPQSQPAASDSPDSVSLSWLHPQGLLSLSFVNFLLRLVTLGVYNFWGKTEVRKRIWSGVRLEGEPLRYTGTGGELFKGFLIIFFVILVPIFLSSAAIAIAFGPESPAYSLYQLLLYIVIFFLIGIGIYRAQRYRLSRTTWRGIRGALTGSDLGYGWAYFWTAALVPMTLGWISPWRAVHLQGLMTRDMRFGDRPFNFTGDPGALYGRFAALWFAGLTISIAALITMGALIDLDQMKSLESEAESVDPVQIMKLVGVIYGVIAVALLCYYVFSAWYRSAMIRHFAANTHFEGARFRSSVTGFGLVWLTISNFLIVLLGWTIGVALMMMIIIGGATLAGPEGGEVAKTLTISLGVILFMAATGLFAPIVQARTARYMIENLGVDGDVSFANIAQGTDTGPARGEGLAQAFDIDGF